MLSIIRQEFTADATFGVMLLRNQIFCYTLELPWNENIPFHSSIPPGIYPIAKRDTWRASQKYGHTYQLTGVPGRTVIQLHPANYPHQLSGCIAEGETIGKMRGERAVKNSGNTFRALMKALSGVDETQIQIMEVRT